MNDGAAHTSAHTPVQAAPAAGPSAPAQAGETPADDSRPFDLLLQASLDEADGGAQDKDNTEDIRVDSKWDSAEEAEDDDSDFDEADAMDEDDDEEYLDTHMQHKRAQRGSQRRSQPRQREQREPAAAPAHRPAADPIAPSTMPSESLGWTGALGYLASIAGPAFVESLDDVQQLFLANLPERLYRGRTQASDVLSLKCSNRECSNVRGNPKKPNSIYCCSKCQSREQNLRQGRVKNVRRLSAASPIAKPAHRKVSRRSSSHEMHAPKRIYSSAPPAIASPYGHHHATPPYHGGSLPIAMRTLPPPVSHPGAQGEEHAARNKLSLSFLLAAANPPTWSPPAQPAPVYHPARPTPQPQSHTQYHGQHAVPRLSFRGHY
eukprot:CAMPEP_0114607580 /NCGR_PEP_ID=MMETSP0168-20121206/2140_1 /TAXON_ID=95228 ORGANISM="Vannella sp., Strain DIVA3 517/6/12" /NCGR_SAMPLE_ID=MMETSP0168 /ASSEMBLY_ACC=CAM_ASM_000044 /LENGTH=376 /DNA_ID=CAMNT_0001818459 /DNA_START=277 /DNA_END=1407 /DNA_ORIENTATION=+